MVHLHFHVNMRKPIVKKSGEKRRMTDLDQAPGAGSRPQNR